MPLLDRPAPTYDLLRLPGRPLPPGLLRATAHGLAEHHLRPLLGHPTLDTLDLRDCIVDTGFLRTLLRSLPALRTLTLWGFGPLALDAVTEHPTLTSLSLHGHPIRSLDTLASLPSLRSLSIASSLHLLSVKDLLSLPSLPSLTELSLSSLLTVGAPDFTAWARLLPSLRALHLHYVPKLYGAGFASLSDFAHLDTFSLRNTRLRDKDLLTLPVSLRLRSLTLRHNKLRGDILDRVPSWPDLDTLDLSESACKPETLAHLTDHPTLANLDLSGLRAATVTLATLASLPQLRRLGANRVKPGPWISVLATHPTLTHLHLANGALTDKQLATLATSKSLEDLNVAGCVKLTSRSINALGKLTSLQQLDLSGLNTLGDHDLVTLSRHPGLRALHLGYTFTFTPLGLQTLAQSPTLRALTLDAQRVLPDTLRALLATAPRDAIRACHGAELSPSVLASLEATYPRTVLRVDAFQRARHHLLANRRVNAPGPWRGRLAVANDVPFPKGEGTLAVAVKMPDERGVLALTSTGSVVTLNPDKSFSVMKRPVRAPHHLLFREGQLHDDAGPPDTDDQAQVPEAVAWHETGPRTLFQMGLHTLVVVTAEATVHIRLPVMYPYHYSGTFDGTTLTLPDREGAFEFDVDTVVAWAREHAP